MLTIVIVDDNASFRKDLSNLLNGRTDIKIAGSAGGAVQGIKLCKRLLPDLILLDICMPKMSGLEAVNRLKKVSPDSKIAFVSAYEKSEYKALSQDLKVYGYVSKRALKIDLFKILNRLTKTKINPAACPL